MLPRRFVDRFPKIICAKFSPLGIDYVQVLAVNFSLKPGFRFKPLKRSHEAPSTLSDNAQGNLLQHSLFLFSASIETKTSQLLIGEPAIVDLSAVLVHRFLKLTSGRFLCSCAFTNCSIYNSFQGYRLAL